MEFVVVDCPAADEEEKGGKGPQKRKRARLVRARAPPPPQFPLSRHLSCATTSLQWSRGGKEGRRDKGRVEEGGGVGGGHDMLV